MKSKFCLLLFILVFNTKLFAADLSCDALLKFNSRNTEDLSLDYFNDDSYLRHLAKTNANGVMSEFFDKDLDTRIFHGNTGLPDLNTGALPKVDPRASGLYVFLHGGGTMSATGRNFQSLMNSLHAYGLAGLSMDLPYHADGPIDDRFHDPGYFMNWIKQVIDKYRPAGMPVYLIGHSFGAEIIPEFMHRHPGFVQGGLSVSLVGFNTVLQDWYEKQTRNMDFGVVINQVADVWADDITEKFIWEKTGSPIGKLTVLSGDREEYVPGPTGGKNNMPTGKNTYDYASAVLRLLPNANVIVAEGVGHYIFDHKDKNGRNVIIREALLRAGINPEIMDIKQQPEDQGIVLFPNTNAVTQKFASDPIFRAWTKAKYKSTKAFMNMLSKRNEKISKQILIDYEIDKKKRESELNL